MALEYFFHYSLQFSLEYASEVDSSGKGYKVVSQNVKEVRFRFIGTGFDHNQNFHFFPFPIGPYMGLCTSFGPPYTGGLL